MRNNLVTLSVVLVSALSFSCARPPQAQQSGGGNSNLPHIDIGELGVDRLRLSAAVTGMPVELEVRGDARLRRRGFGPRDDGMAANR